MHTAQNHRFLKKLNFLISNPSISKQKKMAVISMHTRSNSFPKAPHPHVSQFEEHFNRLKSSASASSSSSFSHKVSGLQDLQDTCDKLLQLSTTQQVLAQGCSQKCVDELVDGSLRLLDICSTAKDCLLKSKESLYEVKSAIRRKGSEAAFTVGAASYLASRKNVKKAIRKALASIKGTRNEIIVIENEMLSLLKETEAVTVSTLESLLRFISDPKGQSKQSRWSSISKLMKTKRVSCDSQEIGTNEFKKEDASLKSHKIASTDNLQGDLGQFGDVHSRSRNRNRMPFKESYQKHSFSSQYLQQLIVQNTI